MTDEQNNTGHCNTGHCNTGHWNTGHCNTGDRNTGDWNNCSRESGFFNTEETKTIRVFNKNCSLESWEKVDKPSCLYFNLTEWVKSEDMSDEEKKAHADYETTVGYLKKHDYKEAFTASMKKASKEELDKVKALPNFDADVFYEISGYRFSDEKILILDGKEISISAESYESLKKHFSEESS